MKTLLYKPLFINPQAYYVFPNINGRLEPKTGSGKESAMFIGNIEVKTIAHGDIGKKQYFYNTNEIDLSAFSNSLVRISLYTNRGNVVLGEWDLDIIEGESENYIDPEILDSLLGVWIADQNTNESESRNIIKNKIVDRGGDLELQNFGYKLNSGYGKYIEDFSLFTLSNRFEYSEISNTKVTITAVLNNSTGIYHSVTEEDSALYWNTFKIKVSGSTDDVYIRYVTDSKNIRLYNGINTVVVPNDLSWHAFVASATNVSCNITLEFVPEYEGALVTDGVDDLIVSQKTSLEIIGGDNRPFTVISMISVINNSRTYYNNMVGTTNMNLSVVNSTVLGKTGIFGYTSTELNTNPSVVNNILGDKNDYSTRLEGASSPVDRRFSVTGYLRDGTPTNVSSIAWYWTFIANKVLTTDQINQVISYFNLDKHVKPDIIYDTIRQGITNENHASFNDELVDFSGNGHNLKLYNLNWDKQSGIGSYPFSFKDYNYFSDRADVSVNKSNFVLTANFDGNNFLEINTKNTEVPSFKIKAEGIDTITNGRLAYRIAASDGSISVKYISEDGEYEIPGSPLTENAAHSGFYVSGGINDNVRVKVTIIPEHEGALVTDGVSDYGKVTGVPIYKDYTVVADRTVIGALEQLDGGVSAKCTNYLNGSFVMDYKDSAFSFGGQKYLIHTLSRIISYQSKYISNGKEIVAGNSSDVSDLYVGKLGIDDRYSAIALYSYLLFPYSLSEFLLERQLKRYKLGTLYPGMIEWRPKVNINVPVVTPPTFSMNNGSDIITNGQYIPEGTEITIRIFTTTDSSVGGINEATAKINGVDIELSPSGNKTYYGGKFIVSSKQKIDTTIDEYIRYENIVQPYPAIINLKQDGKTITWGDKLKVGSDIVFVGSANLLPELYTVSETRYNGVTLYPNTIIKVEKSMVFDNARTYLKANEPSCILSPNRLRIPNSSYKILGYIPDLTGKGNHGRLNNFAYTEESGANEDGSIRFDGKDDHITIPTLAHGGKQVLMKVNYKLNNGTTCTIYDQRNSTRWLPTFCIYSNNKAIAYSDGNSGKTYIDGVLNTSVKGRQLANITHNITIANEDVTDVNSVSPKIGTLFVNGSAYAQMALFDFMLFPEISSEDEIKELNDIVGIEGGYVERPEYYWDACGKTNSDADRATIIDQVSKDPANALTANNFAFNEESGYSQIVDTALFKNWVVLNGTTYIEYTLVNDTTINITKSNRASIDAFYCRTNVKKKSYYRITGLKEGQSVQFGFTNNIICTVESDGVYEVDWSLVSENYQQLGTTFVGDCNIIIEQVAQYPNGLVSDGVEDNLKNTNMPVLTDYTWIMKRKRLDDKNEKTLLHNGDGYSKNAFLFEFTEGGKKNQKFW